MKVTVKNETLSEKEGFTKGLLYIDQESNVVILCTKNHVDQLVGVSVNDTKPYFADDWTSEDYVLFKGTITFEQ